MTREAISVNAFADMLALKKAGKPLPENWHDLVDMYLKFKEKEIERLKWELQSSRNQLKYAKACAKKLMSGKNAA